MNWSKNASFADRLSAAAEAKKAQLERAAQARSEAESPAAIKRRMARDAVKVARDARIAERKATKLADPDSREYGAQIRRQEIRLARRDVAAVSRADHPEPAGIGDRGGEPAASGRSHRRQQDRMLDTEEP